VVDALPGGDPLAAAMAAGETPSPRIVAAAGAAGTLGRRAAWSLLLTIVLLSASAILASRFLSISRDVPFDRSPDVLLDRATTIADTLAVPLKGAPIEGLYERPGYRGWLTARYGRRVREAVRNGPGPVLFRLEYGVSAKESALEPLLAMAPGRTSIEVDTLGRLAFLLAAPADGNVPPRPVDWTKLLDLAGLANATLTPVPPTHAPPAPFDARAAWTGAFSGSETPIRVEAAAWHGRPAFFRITGDWEPASGSAQTPPPAAFAAKVGLIVFALAIFLAWRNFRRRRGDRSGALRVAVATWILSAASALLTMSFASDPLRAFSDSLEVIGAALELALLTFVMYLAIEPYLRQRWPDRLIAWSRLLAGRPNDPMVGRDVLIGVAAGAVFSFAAATTPLLAPWFPTALQIPELNHLRALSSVPHTIATLLRSVISGVGIAFLTMGLLVVATIVFRKRLAAAAVLFVLTLALFLLASSVPLPVAILLAAFLTYVPYRHGLLVIAVLHVVHAALFLFPSVVAPWATALALISYTAVAALALWAFRTSLGGQSAFGDMLEEA
jgi:serine/threonine-protein kinase